MDNFTNEFFTNNRTKFASLVPNTLVVISGHVALQYSADEPYAFRQDSNFWYLTGISEPDLVLTIDSKSGNHTLYVMDQNNYQKDWDGERDTSLLSHISGIGTVKLRSELARDVKEALKAGLEVATIPAHNKRIEPYGFYANPGRGILEEELKPIVHKPRNVILELAKLRQVKQPQEIDAIKQAIAITGKALNDLMYRIDDFTNEQEIATNLQILFLQHGSSGHKFDPIVASGKNAATIHYKNNNQELEKDSLLLFDVGAAVGMYGADISRVYGVGKPNKRKKDVYSALYDAHLQLLEQMKPGVFIKDLQINANTLLKDKFKKLGLAPNELPHGLSHFLGIDTHDAGDYKAELRPGSIITIEPGIYLRSEGIGVRIEDDVLITEGGADVLSDEIPYELL